MKRFKVGDKVRYVRDTASGHDSTMDTPSAPIWGGEHGRVVGEIIRVVVEDRSWDYDVLFADDDLIFSDNELELYIDSSLDEGLFEI